MKRTIALTLVLAVVAVFSVSAQVRGGSPGPMMGPGTALEEVELTGRLRLAEDQLPVLVSGANEYTLRISPVLSSEFQVTNGQQASLSGYLVERPSRDLLGTTSTVMVRTIEVNGTRYVMPQRAGGTMMDRRGRTDDGTWGPRRAPEAGPAMPRGGRR